MKKANEQPFNLTKRKYKKDEVTLLLTEKDRIFGEEIQTLKTAIDELKAENEKLSKQLAAYTEKSALIESAIVDSRAKAEETEKKAKLRYSLAVEKIKNFSKKWNDYFNCLVKKYPLYSVAQKSAELGRKIDEVLSCEGDESAIEVLNKDLDEMLSNTGNKVFDPKEKIREYVAATSDNGFDLNEVLNPGELKLEDLCKELGLTD